jgi:branched-chain amino acid transport system substrate-binding protein
MNKTTKTILGVVIVIILAFLVWYGASQKPQAPVSKEPIKIGGAFALTGDAAEWGQGDLEGAQMAIDEVNESGGINGRELKLIAEDTQTTAIGTVNAINKLVNVDGVQVIIGPTWGDSFQGGIPIIEQNKVVLITPSAAVEAVPNKEKYTYFLSTYFPQKDEMLRIQKYAFSKGVKNFVVVYDLDPFNKYFGDLFISTAPQNSLTVVKSFAVQREDKDFRTVVAQIKNLSPRPDAVFFEVATAAQVGTFAKQLKEQGITIPIWSNSSFEDLTLEVCNSFQKNLLDGAVYTRPKVAVKDFKQKYFNKYHKELTRPTVSNAYDATMAVIEALKRGAQTGEQIKNELYKIKIPGVTFKEISFNQFGQVSGGEFSIKTIQNCQFLELE